MHRQELINLLKRLYGDQLAIEREEYLYLQSRTDVGIGRRVDVFLKYQSFLLPGVVLDWGCKHSIDGCLIKHKFGDKVEMHGCDVGQNNFPAFHNFAELKFTQLTHPFKLPYHDNQFDLIVASGALEHVPNDSESLKELYRTLKPGGRLIITFLPNQSSYTEIIVSAFGGPAHKRVYRASEVKKQFLHHGFEPLLIGYHQVTPSLSSLGSQGLGEMNVVKSFISFLYMFNKILETIWLVRGFAANIIIVAQKVEYF